MICPLFVYMGTSLYLCARTKNAVRMKKLLILAHLSVTFALVLVVLSIVLGCRSYHQAKSRIVADLSHAVQQVAGEGRDVWLSVDSIRSYRHWQQAMGAPVTVSSANRRFVDALTIPRLRGVSSLSWQIYERRDAMNKMPSLLPEGCLASDTLVWLTTTSGAEELTVAFRGYARCDTFLIGMLADWRWPGALLILALLCGVCAIFCRRKIAKGTGHSAPRVITYGNLSWMVHEACFRNPQGEILRLTPMQYALMEMFYQNAAHRLTKTDICQTLWPGKDNADETLYTLIRRLKPVVEAYSNLSIHADRGKAYELKIQD